MALDRQQREALDRHITGNYGADQFDAHDATVVVFFTSKRALDAAHNAVSNNMDPHRILADVLEQGAGITFDLE